MYVSVRICRCVCMHLCVFVSVCMCECVCLWLSLRPLHDTIYKITELNNVLLGWLIVWEKLPMHCQLSEKIPSVSPRGIISSTSDLGYKTVGEIAINVCYISSKSHLSHPAWNFASSANLSILHWSFFLWLWTIHSFTNFVHNIWQSKGILNIY